MKHRARDQELLDKVIHISHEAGRAIMDIYRSDDFEVETKKDKEYESPLTLADKTANHIIETGLRKISSLPIVSEEGNHQVDGEEEFWLVDPLDGTKEFIKKNGEFCVNIGLIKGKRPVLGVVYVPDKGATYAASEGSGSFKIDSSGERQPISAIFKGDTPVIVSSRSHPSEHLEKMLQKIGPYEVIEKGSLLKVCLVAEGAAQIYPRLGPTYLWDTAAADAIITEAGGEIINLNGDSLLYDPMENLKNPFFVARAGNDDIFDKLKGKF